MNDKKMNLSIYRVIVHRYAPELNQIEMTNGELISAPQVTTFEGALRFLIKSQRSQEQ